ncbi:MAG TPA: hypothetical protein TECP_01092 [Hyphomicrobiaceae bacterium MAG_BT-2024]
MRKVCKNHKLVENNLCTVSYCEGCDKMNLNLGAMTLHLTTNEFEGLLRSFQEAAYRRSVIKQIGKETHMKLMAESNTLQ